MNLIVDTKYKGHHSEFLDIIINDFINKEKAGTFLVHPVFLKKRPYLKNHGFLKFFIWRSSNSLLNLIKELHFIKSIIYQQGVTKCILLDLNYYFKILPFVKISKCSLAAIYFSPFLMKERIGYKEKKLKSFFFKRLLNKKCFSKAYILNDHKAVDIFNQYFNTSKFKYLVDPAFSSNYTNVIEHSKKEDLKNFAFLGEISKRKGIFKLLDAIYLLPKEILSSISFTIAGNAPEDREEITRIINKLQYDKKAVFKEVILERISDSKFDELLSKADVILALHQLVENSSGIIGKAALFHKPLIGSNKGLIGELIKQYEMGAKINTSNPDEISKCIIDFTLTNKNVNIDKLNKYIEERSPINFTKTLLEK